MDERLLVGSNLAVLVAASELVARGLRVRVITDGAALGGHFRGSVVDDHAFDNGMVLLERRAGESSPLSVGPGPSGHPVRQDWTRFGQQVDDWFTKRFTLARVPPLEVSVAGRRWPDHLLSNRLDVFRDAGVDEPGPLEPDDPRHPAVKATSARFEDITYGELAPVVHGPSNHATLVAPFAEKVLGPAHGEVLARHHRSGWLPLYWPETVARARAGQQTGLPEYPFWSVAGGYAHHVVTRLVRELDGAGTCCVDTSPVQALARDGHGWHVSTVASGSVTSTRVGLGLAPQRLQSLSGDESCAAVGTGPANAVDLLFCLVRGEFAGAPVSSLLVTEDHLDTYRITDQDVVSGQDRRWHHVVVEARSRGASVEERTDALVAEACGLLDVDVGHVRVLGARRAGRAIPLLTASVVRADVERSAAQADWARGGLLSGALLGLHQTSMNDQIVQGLDIARELT
ncbi:FAD/NAD(P)-binding protein [Kineococcus sp. NPDC059986]|uniref:NAD(P)-binding protein n=1 Tax=Kineococcus sp. NPDC059986 TaxID=3155538 RepID=UPI0034508DE8